jgi:hypothetical protein
MTDPRRQLARSPSLDVAPAVAAALGVRFFDHIGDVYARLESVATDWRMKAVVLVHEEPPAHAVQTVVGAGLPEVAPLADAVLRGFGDVWKLPTAAWLATHRAHADALLLFEVVHEGRPTASMLDAADAAGIGGAVRRWSDRLAAFYVSQRSYDSFEPWDET